MADRRLLALAVAALVCAVAFLAIGLKGNIAFVLELRLLKLAALVQEACFFHLEAPVARVTGWDTPYPHAQEWDYFPGPARVGRALTETLEA